MRLPQYEPYNPDCDDCHEHERGICWKHKCENMRQGKVSIAIPPHFKAPETQREIMREIDEARRQPGAREIQKVR